MSAIQQTLWVVPCRSLLCECVLPKAFYVRGLLTLIHSFRVVEMSWGQHIILLCDSRRPWRGFASAMSSKEGVVERIEKPLLVRACFETWSTLSSSAAILDRFVGMLLRDGTAIFQKKSRLWFRSSRARQHMLSLEQSTGSSLVYSETLIREGNRPPKSRKEKLHTGTGNWRRLLWYNRLISDVGFSICRTKDSGLLGKNTNLSRLKAVSMSGRNSTALLRSLSKLFGSMVKSLFHAAIEFAKTHSFSCSGIRWATSYHTMNLKLSSLLMSHHFIHAYDYAYDAQTPKICGRVLALLNEYVALKAESERRNPN